MVAAPMKPFIAAQTSPLALERCNCQIAEEELLWLWQLKFMPAVLYHELSITYEHGEEPWVAPDGLGEPPKNISQRVTAVSSEIHDTARRDVLRRLWFVFIACERHLSRAATG